MGSPRARRLENLAPGTFFRARFSKSPAPGPPMIRAMSTQGFTIFETAIGPCGIAWRATGIAGFQLPEQDEARTRVRLARRFPDLEDSRPPASVLRTQRDVIALLQGEARDLSSVPLDMDGLPPFRRRVYEAARRIPAGTTCSYGELARRLGEPGAARAVGQAMGRNPFAILVPCHRVVAAHGRIGGFSADGGIDTKQRLLAIEGTCKGNLARGRD